MADPDHPSDAFFLIVADLDTGMFCVEGSMSDDARWHFAAGRARQLHDRHDHPDHATGVSRGLI